jgi:hypothetical protein
MEVTMTREEALKEMNGEVNARVVVKVACSPFKDKKKISLDDMQQRSMELWGLIFTKAIHPGILRALSDETRRQCRFLVRRRWGRTGTRENGKMIYV